MKFISYNMASQRLVADYGSSDSDHYNSDNSEENLLLNK